jgi:hypothetical protein
VDFPLPSAAYERHLKKLIAASKPKKKAVRTAKADLSRSFA